MLELGTKIKILEDVVLLEEKILYKEGCTGTVWEIDKEDCDGLCYGIKMDNPVKDNGFCWFKENEIEEVNM